MRRVLSGIVGAILLLCSIFMIVEAGPEIQRTYELRDRRLASYLLSLLVGLCISIGGGFLLLRYFCVIGIHSVSARVLACE